MLGIQWLEQLGNVMCNWEKMFMVFQWNNKPVTLQGIGTQDIQPASVQALSKELQQGHSLFTIYPEFMLLQNETHSNMQHLLDEFIEIFQEPS